MLFIVLIFVGYVIYCSYFYMLFIVLICIGYVIYCSYFHGLCYLFFICVHYQEITLFFCLIHVYYHRHHHHHHGYDKIEIMPPVCNLRQNVGGFLEVSASLLVVPGTEIFDESATDVMTSKL